MAGDALAHRRTECPFVLDGKGISGVESADLARLQQAHTELVAGKARLESALESERKTNAEKMELMTHASQRANEDLRNAFKAMASDALKSNNLSFLVMAEGDSGSASRARPGETSKPASKSSLPTWWLRCAILLNKVDRPDSADGSRARGDAYGELRAQVQSLITTQKELQSETGNLVQALRTPQRARTLGRNSVAAAWWRNAGGDALLLRFHRSRSR